MSTFIRSGKHKLVNLDHVRSIEHNVATQQLVLHMEGGERILMLGVNPSEDFPKVLDGLRAAGIVVLDVGQGRER